MTKFPAADNYRTPEDMPDTPWAKRIAEDDRQSRVRLAGFKRELAVFKDDVGKTPEQRRARGAELQRKHRAEQRAAGMKWCQKCRTMAWHGTKEHGT